MSAYQKFLKYDGTNMMLMVALLALLQVVSSDPFHSDLCLEPLFAQCPSPPLVPDNAFFVDKCDWGDNSQDCPIRKDLNGSDFKGKMNIYFMGNSVDRHYSFEVLRFLDPNAYQQKVNGRYDRLTEKNICDQHLLDMASCDHWTTNKDTLVRYIVNDPIAQAEDLLTMFDPKKHFKDAKPSDLLIIGLKPKALNASIACTDPGKHRNNCASDWCESWYSEFVGNTPHSVSSIIHFFLKHFPGRIIFHSFSYLHVDVPALVRNEQSTCRWINRCRDILTNVVRCGVTVTRSPRVRYLNLDHLLRAHPEGYQDIIHHYGPLSSIVVEMIYSMITPPPITDVKARGQ